MTEDIGQRLDGITGRLDTLAMSISELSERFEEVLEQVMYEQQLREDADLLRED